MSLVCVKQICLKKQPIKNAKFDAFCQNDDLKIKSFYESIAPLMGEVLRLTGMMQMEIGGSRIDVGPTFQVVLVILEWINKKINSRYN